MPRNTFFALFAALLLLPACYDSTGPEYSRLGRYTLRRINGGTLPGEVYENAVARIQFNGGTLHLKSDLTFVDSTLVQVYRKGEGDSLLTTDVAAGTYRFSGDTVHLSSSRGEIYFMVYSAAGSLMQTLEGSVLLYRK
jgi:hypothetical protein